jgi:hypothetical protein
VASKSFTIEVETKAFNEHIKQFMAKSSVGIDMVIKKFAFDLLRRIILKSPV